MPNFSKRVADNIVRDENSGTYYLQAKVNGSKVRKSLRTDSLKIGELISKLKPGAIIKIGEESSECCRFKAGELITLAMGTFDHENGLHTQIVKEAGIWNEDAEDWDSIYHIWGNDLEYFLDSEIITNA